MIKFLKNQNKSYKNIDFDFIQYTDENLECFTAQWTAFQARH